MTDRLAGVRLAPYTTLRVGGPARAFAEAGSAEELIGLVAGADRDGEPVLVLGGGSNLVVADEGFAGLVVRVRSRGVAVSAEGERVVVTAEAGEDWDALVARCVAEGLAGIECLSGIPGLAGATPIQNVGAYGQEVAQTITSVRVYDRRAGATTVLTPEECRFGYRHSLFKEDPGRYVVLSVSYALTRSRLSTPIAYRELAAALGVEQGERAPLAEVRAAVLELRRRKGMVLDPGDPDTRSAGSFFTNPILTREQAAELELRAPGFPRWDMPDGTVKVPAAWLIENAGFPKGYARGRARISTKHTLAITNPSGEATAREVLALAREIRAGVQEKFGVELVNEPVMVGISL
ncbi:UDP-N-acetylenolpyruvoylglucosamine reductase [Thermobispora bispora]|uniref:UDP-N-acetylenolpyruvoylglucosamine reductase n=1 Tax=Thermobispora bispora (strain ATCC 19993 / DSM 43833 / CBS 139.67 / JCM 10125 / KCTC 9307 / NBRC 14880 / R51) TaxID=469371 RepID=D6Y3R0_THEBD|nr:UDP-N-acetylmuramate dehydrogenase [Thermobispora bispora]ADG87089.1 UDP-N-acetylenolpyruvoylglucosamine reductase [Thermobispora bispora DSM 43833]QSI47061.1 UDP-N-acetylmuramate dehydrogenase [Thermobispora bispora]